MAGLLSQQPQQLQQVFSGVQQPTSNQGLLNSETPEQRKNRESYEFAMNTGGIQKADPVTGKFDDGGTWGGVQTFNPEQEQRQSVHKYVKEPGDYTYDSEVEKGIVARNPAIGIESIKAPELVSVYMRDVLGKPTDKMQSTNDWLRSRGLSRQDAINLVEGTQWGQDMLRGKLEHMGVGREQQARGPGGSEFAESISQMGLSQGAVGTNIGGIVENAGLKFITPQLDAMGFDSRGVKPLYNAIKGAATGQDIGQITKQATKDGLKLFAREVGKVAKDKLGTSFPIAGLLGAGTKIAGDIMNGMKPMDAIGDAFSGLGINMTAAMVGSIFGPVGTFLAPVITSMIVGDNLVSQGVIGDMFDSRSNEYFRDAFEDMGLSKKEKADLVRMANSAVNPASQLTQLERIKGYGTGSGTGSFNVGGATGTSTGTGGGYNIGGGQVSGL